MTDTLLTNLDELDRRLLALLRSNARMPVSSLAASLKIARATVKSRMERLEKNGVILGYSVKTLDTNSPNQVQAFMLLSVQGKAANTVLRILKGYPEITTLQITNGRWDIMLHVAVGSLAELEQTLRKIRTIDGVSNSETNILLSQQK